MLNPVLAKSCIRIQASDPGGHAVGISLATRWRGKEGKLIVQSTGRERRESHGFLQGLLDRRSWFLPLLSLLLLMVYLSSHGTRVDVSCFFPEATWPSVYVVCELNFFSDGPDVQTKTSEVSLDKFCIRCCRKGVLKLHLLSSQIWL